MEPVTVKYVFRFSVDELIGISYTFAFVPSSDFSDAAQLICFASRHKFLISLRFFFLPFSFFFLSSFFLCFSLPSIRRGRSITFCVEVFLLSSSHSAPPLPQQHTHWIKKWLAVFVRCREEAAWTASLHGFMPAFRLKTSFEDGPRLRSLAREKCIILATS